jgi:hypothetical protein
MKQATCHLSPEQIKKRGQILQRMADQYLEARPYLRRNEAYAAFGASIEHDPVKLRIINALAAMK